LYTCLEQGRVGIFESPTGTVFCFHNSTPWIPAAIWTYQWHLYKAGLACAYTRLYT
jgi:hypothetical protein